jgi:hypothetical protein
MTERLLLVNQSLSEKLVLPATRACFDLLAHCVTTISCSIVTIFCMLRSEYACRLHVFKFHIYVNVI